jgi:hypothetical protein
MSEAVGVSSVVGKVYTLPERALVCEALIETLLGFVDKLRVCLVGSMEKVLHDVFGLLMWVLP